MNKQVQSKQVHLGPAEASAIGMVFVGAKAFLGYPRFLAEVGSTAGWLVALTGGVLSMGIWLVVADLLGRFPGKSLPRIAEEVLGPILGLMTNVSIILLFIVGNSNILRLFSEVMIITALPEAPISSLVFLFVIPVIFAVYCGLEPISRSSFIALPFILVGTLSVLLALYPFWDFNQLFPLLGSGPVKLLLYSGLNVSSFSDIIILAYLVPYFSFDSKRLKAVGLTSLALITAVFVLIVAVYLMVLPVPGAVENLVPFYQLSRTIYLGRYFQRVEAIFILFWTFTAFLRLSIGLLVVALAVKETLHLPQYRPLLPALVIIIIALALTPADLMTAVMIDKYIRVYTGWFFTFAIPVFIWLIAKLRGKGGTHDQSAKQRPE